MPQCHVWLSRTYKSWEDFFLGSAVLGQYGHSVALEMAGTAHWAFLSRTSHISFPALVSLVLDAPWLHDTSEGPLESSNQGGCLCRCYEEFRALPASLYWWLVSVSTKRQHCLLGRQCQQ